MGQRQDRVAEAREVRDEGGTTTGKRPRRRVAQLVAAAVAALLVGVALTGPDALRDLGRGGGDAEDIGTTAAGELDEAAQISTLATVHDYLNWVIWGGGVFDARDFGRQLDRVIVAHADQGNDEVAETLRVARDLAIRDRRLVDAHDLVQRHEYRLRGSDPPPDAHPTP